MTKKDYTWKETKYRAAKAEFQHKLDIKKVKPYDLMEEYKKAVVNDEFEVCKALTEILKPLNYLTSDTHQHIKQLQEV